MQRRITRFFLKLGDASLINKVEVMPLAPSRDDLVGS